MIPQYVRQVAPERPGQRLAGLGAQAQSQVGQAIVGLGTRIADRGQEIATRGDALAASRAWRQIDEWRIGYLRQLPDRRKDLSVTQIDPVSGANITGYERELDAFPDALREQIHAVSKGLSSAAKARLQLAYDEAAPRWAQEIATVLDRMEIADVVVEARDLARQGRAASGLELIDLYKDRLGPENYEKLTAEIRLSGAQSDLQEIARVGGWQQARQTLQDPQWQQVYGLDVAQAATIRNQLEGFVDQEAQKQERIAAVEREMLERKRIDQAYQGQLETDEEGVAIYRKEYLRGQLTDKAYETIRRLEVRGPRTENDPETYAKLVELKDRVARGAAPAAELKSFATAHADQLTPAAYKDAIDTAGSPFAMQTQAKNDAVQRAYGQFVKVQETDLQALLMQGASQEAMRSAGEVRAQQLNLVNMLSDELEEWIRNHPEASRADILRQGRMIQVQIGMRSIEEQDARIRQWQASAGGPIGPEGSAVAGNLGNLQPRSPDSSPDTPAPRNAVPAGLESIWDQLDSEAKADVMRLLARGRTAEDILRIWQENP